jgi:hypothetical protein
MTLYDQTVTALRAAAARAAASDDVLFCERRPLTSLEADFAGASGVAANLRPLEDEALRTLKLLVDSEQGYESALRAVQDAGAEATEWVQAVMLARALEALDAAAGGA